MGRPLTMGCNPTVENGAAAVAGVDRGVNLDGQQVEIGMAAGQHLLAGYHARGNRHRVSAGRVAKGRVWLSGRFMFQQITDFDQQFFFR